MLPVSLFNVARYLTDSLRGPVEPYGERTKCASLMGLDGPQKCPLNLFILRYIKHYTHMHIYIYEKKSPGKFLVRLKIWKSWGSG